MKALRSPLALSTLVLIQACSTAPSSDTQEVSVAPIMASLDAPETIAPQPFIIRGEVVLGHETRAIKPCGSQQQYWVNLPVEQREQAISLTARPYQPLYGELIGYLTPPSHHGFDSDYDAVLNVTAVNILSAENPNRCNQDLRPTRAFGTEPFWSASFEPQGLSFAQIGQEPSVITIKAQQSSQQQRSYTLDKGQSLTLTQKACSDGMSDSLYGWQSSLSLADRDYQGCATLSNQDHSLEWVGAYQAAATDNPQFNIHLELNADHSARTTYEYLDGQPSTIEQGYWQQLNDQQVMVTMTRHQRQHLVSQRIFTREGEMLKADKEQVSDIVYPIANGGLTLFKAVEQTTSSPQQ
ncbi:COG3650 family protein [Vibrio sp. WXL210]|uniref:COG3650 family protein n=1 Tax=Vibrio sp. WXL210 TaxID=3450709 RepID=UPI003EC8266F